ncbi:arylsulfatase [Polynucleobacter sp. 71A-WALBACH]|uniref:arylsulfatase n=1 Tax=Polynucleobacter sp. 71A-WALBACH TaxID=2689097 RepID=UPI001C0B56FD|nr:arylsulfatase [Polynucleobacter sp. 71A-WALBACH]MBU3593590.1 arylsulfatase [Polynucleobacter sp. 71A-WALBACH]
MTTRSSIKFSFDFKRRLPALSAMVFTVPLLASIPSFASDIPRRPNIVIILGDDLGFADMGAFGSEIKTPNLDAIAKNGVRFTNFYTHPTSSPTRAALMSGVDTHVSGLGNMDEWIAPNQQGISGYEGYLNDRVTTLPEILKTSGYHTYMVGKWHLGKAPNQIPAARGFERDFSLLDGAGSYWDMTNFTGASPKSVFTEDGKYLTELPTDYYATKTYTDKLIDFIDSNHDDGKPFFAYVSQQAPHDPYHLPEEWRSRHVGEYDIGWDAVRQSRLKRQIELGITPAGTELSERMWFLPDPITLAPVSRALLGKKMELYAGMVENLDFHVGRLVDHLKQIGEYENTIFIVFGDNGAEGSDLFKMISGSPGSRDFLFAAMNWSQTHPNAWGGPQSYVAYGPMWAQVSMTPFSQYKGWMAEGGIRNALIVSGPPVTRPKGSINDGLMHVADIMPTLLEIAGATYPSKDKEGHALPPLIGKSWNPLLTNKVDSPRSKQDYLAWEIFGNRAVRQGDWKLRWQYKPFGTGEWELFEVTKDPAERKNLANDNPEKLKSMLVLWDDFVLKNHVILPSRSPFETLDDTMPMRVPVDPGFPPLIYKKQFIPPKNLIEGVKN